MAEKEYTNSMKKSIGKPINLHPLTMEQSIPVVDLAPGSRIRVTAKPIGVTLTLPTGVVIGPSEWEGYYVIRLDAPAVYHRADGADEAFEELVEAFDNFAVLTPQNERSCLGNARPSLRVAHGEYGMSRAGITRRVYHGDDGYEYEPCPMNGKYTWHQIAVRDRAYRDIDPDTGEPIAGSEGNWRPLK